MFPAVTLNYQFTIFNNNHFNLSSLHLSWLAPNILQLMGFQILTKLFHTNTRTDRCGQIKGVKVKNKLNEKEKEGEHKRKPHDIKNTVLLFSFYCYFLGSYWIRWIASSLSRTPWINSPSANRSKKKIEKERVRTLNVTGQYYISFKSSFLTLPWYHLPSWKF